MSFTIHGIGVSGGIAIGHAQLMTHAGLDVPRYAVDAADVPAEAARFRAAVQQVRAELEEVRAGIPATAPAELAAFINLHLMILSDAMLSEAPLAIIERERCNAEWALKVQTDALLAQFEEIEDEYLRERKVDVIQVAERVMKALSGQPGHVARERPDGAPPVILVAHDLSPADVVQFRRHRFASFITDLGGATSHTAVVARSLAIPSIVALHRARQMIRENELIIVDGSQGVVIVDPDEQVLAEYRRRQQEFELERRKLLRLRDRRPVTLDGTSIELQANIELPADVALARDHGATGIGLFRSEFLFLNRAELPGEDEQFEAYRRVAEEMDGLPVTIRTYDMGADKSGDNQERVTTNPALGLRAIRLCLTEPQRFLTQLRALLRASHYGRIQILIPMLATASEIDQTLVLIRRARQSLDDAGIPYDRSIRIGGMIEVPAAALSLGLFLRKLDFVSIGTNDLIQYTLAVDRTDDTVSHLYDPLHPAVLNLIAGVIRAADRAGIPVALCGEMAGDTSLTRLLLALGLRNFSMHVAHLLDVKQVILNSECGRLQPLARRLLRVRDPVKARRLLAELNAL